MPTYEYICESCGYEFEQFQAIKDKPIRKCPKCDKTSARRLIGVGAGVIFKGPGFYATDYRTESYKKAAESEKSTTTTDSDKKETKSSEKAEASTKDKNTHYPLREKSA